MRERVNRPEHAAGRGRRVLICDQNLPVPFDRRVWQEAGTLAGYLLEYPVALVARRRLAVWIRLRRAAHG